MVFFSSPPPRSLFFPVEKAVWKVKFCLNTLIFLLGEFTFRWLLCPEGMCQFCLFLAEAAGKAGRALGKERLGTPPSPASPQGSCECRFLRETSEVNNNLPSRQLASQGKYNFTDMKKILFWKMLPVKLWCLPFLLCLDLE